MPTGGVENSNQNMYSDFAFQFRHRLVRHMWNINVNESLSLEANCSIGNAATQELGLDINIKNLNQVHHPLMTEISVADLVLYCPVYDLKQNDITCM